MAFTAQYLAPFALTSGAALGYQFADRATLPGRVWVNLSKPVRLTTAERIAQHARTDGHEVVRVHAIARRIPAVRS
jgi:predicted alpha/beta hydrolase